MIRQRPRNRRRRCAAWLVSLVATASFSIGLSAPSAAAGDSFQKTTDIICQGSDCLQARVEKGQGKVWAKGFYSGKDAVLWTTIVLYQCDGRGRNCGVMSSRYIPIVDFTWESTSSKRYARGHTYKACVSGPPGWGLVNICTPLMAWNATH